MILISWVGFVGCRICLCYNDIARQVCMDRMTLKSRSRSYIIKIAHISCLLNTIQQYTWGHGGVCCQRMSYTKLVRDNAVTTFRWRSLQITFWKGWMTLKRRSRSCFFNCIYLLFYKRTIILVSKGRFCGS